MGIPTYSCHSEEAPCGPTWESVLLRRLAKSYGLPHQSADWFAMTCLVRRFLSKNAGLFGGFEIAFRQLFKGRMDRPGARHDDDIPAALELFLVEPVDFTQSSADTVAHIGFPQLFADGNTHPVGGSAIFSGIEHQMAVCLSAGLVKTLEYVVELE